MQLRCHPFSVSSRLQRVRAVNHLLYILPHRRFINPNATSVLVRHHYIRMEILEVLGEVECIL